MTLDSLDIIGNIYIKQTSESKVENKSWTFGWLQSETASRQEEVWESKLDLNDFDLGVGCIEGLSYSLEHEQS